MQPHRWLTGLQHDSIDQKFVLNNVKLRPKGRWVRRWTSQDRERMDGENRAERESKESRGERVQSIQSKFWCCLFQSNIQSHPESRS